MLMSFMTLAVMTLAPSSFTTCMTLQKEASAADSWNIFCCRICSMPSETCRFTGLSLRAKSMYSPGAMPSIVHVESHGGCSLVHRQGYVQLASLHMCGSDCHFNQQRKNDATTLAMSSPAAYVHPTNTVAEWWHRGRGVH